MRAFPINNGMQVFLIEDCVYERVVWAGDRPCRCGAVPGEYHAGGGACANEPCPKCEDQPSVTCACSTTAMRLDRPSPTRAPARTLPVAKPGHVPV